MAEILALVINLFQFKDILDLKYTGIYFNIIIRCTLILRLTFEGEKCVLYIHTYTVVTYYIVFSLNFILIFLSYIILSVYLTI